MLPINNSPAIIPTCNTEQAIIRHVLCVIRFTYINSMMPLLSKF